MRPTKYDNMRINYIDAEKITGKKTNDNQSNKRISCHAFFLYDGHDANRKKVIDDIIRNSPNKNIKVQKLGCSHFGIRPYEEKKKQIFDGISEKIRSKAIGDDTIIFMYFHTNSGKDIQSFSFHGINEKILISAEELYQHVWSHFPGEKKPSFHNLGCNAGYYARDLQHVDGNVINYAGESPIGARESICQVKEILTFIAEETEFNGCMPSSEKVWEHLRSYATQNVSLTGKKIYKTHDCLEVLSGKVNEPLKPIKVHQSPKLLIEYAFRHRPLQQVLRLIKIHDPQHQLISRLSEKAKRRILFHVIPNRVPWLNFTQQSLVTPSTIEAIEKNDSLKKFLFLKENNLLPKMIDTETANRFFVSCCEQGHSTIAEHLLEIQSFNVSERGKECGLVHAIISESIAIAKVLIDEVPTLHLQDLQDNSLFHFASKLKSSAIMKMLVAPENLAKFSTGPAEKQYAARKKLLDGQNFDDVRPLELAIRSNNVETVQYLLTAGANPYELNSKNKRFIHQAIFCQNPAIFELLLAIETNAVDKALDLSALLQTSIANSKRKIASILIKHFEDTGKVSELNREQASGLTPLLLAAKKMDIPLVRALLDAGADPNIHSTLGNNALHLVLRVMNLTQKTSRSTQHRPSLTSSEELARQKLNFSHIALLVKTLIERGVSVNTADNSGNTPLIMAAKAQNLPLVDLLLSQGANINVKNNIGYTALHYALWNEDKALSKYLLQKGIDLDAASFNRKLALKLAKKWQDTAATHDILATIARRAM